MRAISLMLFIGGKIMFFRMQFVSMGRSLFNLKSLTKLILKKYLMKKRNIGLIVSTLCFLTATT